ncbi:uncharacterized protein LOC5667468 isoform X1 [Anopheles gambiae]|uniref:uncharacterized protein LOC5667468 isoform X1 n=1 Tax=Anopheles gambiae TaxID=7165 RepID=UPI002AC8C440|nr:uncharacterized protein LOC5667468 isoform X1 [Anopheles gambiae]
MNALQSVKSFFLPTSSADWWVQFRKWEHLCCPKQPTVRLVFLFLFFLLLELTVFAITLLYVPSRMHTGSFFLDNGVPAILIIATTGSVVKLSHMLSQRHRIGAISDTLQQFDHTIQMLDFRMKCDEIVYWTAGWSITFAITTLIFSVTIKVFGSVVFEHVGTGLMIVFINITNIPYSVFTVWFIVCELCIRCRMQLLHSLLDGGMRSMAPSRRIEMVKRSSQLLAGVTNLHADLSSIVGHVSAIFCVQVTISLSAFTILLIFCIFSYYRAAVVMGEIETNFAWLTICWSLYNSCFQIPKVLFGAWIRQGSNQLTKLVHHHLRHADEFMVQNQLFILSQQLEHYSLTIRPWYYTINWPVYATVRRYAWNRCGATWAGIKCHLFPVPGNWLYQHVRCNFDTVR